MRPEYGYLFARNERRPEVRDGRDLTLITRGISIFSVYILNRMFLSDGRESVSDKVFFWVSRRKIGSSIIGS